MQAKIPDQEMILEAFLEIPPLNVCLDRNSKRVGVARVYDFVIHEAFDRMHNIPESYWDYIIDNIQEIY